MSSEHRGAPRRRWVGRAGRLASAVAASALGLAGLAVPSLAATTPPDASANYSFFTLNDSHDPTFNQLLGINDSGVIAGYFGSGEKGHPNKGYVLTQPYGQGSYHNENFPGSAQTQVVGINAMRDTVGFWVDGNGANHGFVEMKGRRAKTVDFPTNDNAKPKFDQLLGINNADIAVGFYNDAKGNPHGFTYNVTRHRFRTVNVAGDSGVTAAAINNENDVAGFATNSSGTTEGFLRRSDGKVFHLDVPGAAMTQAFGVNDGDEVVGAYTVGTGSNAMSYGFIWAPGFGFETVNDPHGVGSTVINGVNDRGTLVGFYTDAAGNTDGMLARATP
jgi:hypothetical protein